MFLRHISDVMRSREKLPSSTTCEDGDTANHIDVALGRPPILSNNHLLKIKQDMILQSPPMTVYVAMIMELSPELATQSNVSAIPHSGE